MQQSALFIFGYSASAHVVCYIYNVTNIATHTLSVLADNVRYFSHIFISRI